MRVNQVSLKYLPFPPIAPSNLIKLLPYFHFLRFLLKTTYPCKNKELMEHYETENRTQIILQCFAVSKLFALTPFSTELKDTTSGFTFMLPSAYRSII